MGLEIFKSIKYFFSQKSLASFWFSCFSCQNHLFCPLAKFFFNMVSYSRLHNLTFLSCFLFSRFVTFIWDNNDINLETLTDVSMHCTNGTMVQICTKREAVSINKWDRDVTRKRSFSSLPNTMTCNVSKKPVDPSHMVQIDLEESIMFSL